MRGVGHTADAPQTAATAMHPAARGLRGCVRLRAGISPHRFLTPPRFLTNPSKGIIAPHPGFKCVRRTTFRSSSVTHVLESGYDIPTAPVCVPGTDRQEPLGHADVNTTVIYTHALNRGPAAVRSPADRLRVPPQPFGSYTLPARGPLRLQAGQPSTAY